MAYNLYYTFPMLNSPNKNYISRDDLAEREDNPFTLKQDGGIGLRKIIAEVEKTYILKALEDVGWIQIKAAERLGISQRMLGYKIKKYGITLKPKQKEEGR